jgi:2-polyprenyl-6-hydroxyphenyl methylase / 3-demethylubiquinone-9 3-methyltransferase
MKNNTINKKEIDKFSKIAEEWWNPEGKFKPLHKFNPTRITYVKDHIINTLKLNNEKKPLKKIKILDIGCGGGLLSEPMSRLGAEVVGIDASDKNIKVAKLHAKKNSLDIKYFCTSPENFKTDIKFDVILNMEIIEHVEDVDYFLMTCAKLLKNNGIMFVATINKTLKSYLFAIIGAEYILQWLPIGTHDWEKFIKPDDLVNILKKYKLQLDSLDGMKFNLIKDEWNLSSDNSINYIGKFIKN